MKRTMNVFLFTLIIMSLFNIYLSDAAKAEKSSSLDVKLKTYFSEKIPDANITSVKVIKRGDVVSVTRQEFLTDNVKEDLERPILVHIKGKCKYSDKIIDENVEEVLHKDKWGEWAIGQGTTTKNSFTWGIVRTMRRDDRCPESPEIVRQKEAAAKQKQEQEAARKREKEEEKAAVERETQQNERERNNYLHRFVRNDDKTITDTVTHLMWSAEYTINDLSWEEANNFCKSFRGGEYTDWRLPTLDELTGTEPDDVIMQNKNPIGLGFTYWSSYHSCYNFYNSEVRTWLGCKVRPVRDTVVSKEENQEKKEEIKKERNLIRRSSIKHPRVNE